MKTKNHILHCSLSILFFAGCSLGKDTPASVNNAVGSISAMYNGTSWTGNWASSIVGNFGGTKILTISGQISEKNTSEAISIGINRYSGPASYEYSADGKGSVTISIKYKGKNYSNNDLLNGGGTGTIKITEYVESKDILNPGKVVGEFSGTIKSIDSAETLTITKGSFTSIKYL